MAGKADRLAGWATTNCVVVLDGWCGWLHSALELFAVVCKGNKSGGCAVVLHGELRASLLSLAGGKIVIAEDNHHC
jgi:uncharacterized protein YhfF